MTPFASLPRLEIRVIQKSRCLFQGQASSFWILEEYSGPVDGNHDQEDKIVFPGNRFQGNRVDQDVEDRGEDGGNPSYGQASRPQIIRPKFARVCHE